MPERINQFLIAIQKEDFNSETKYDNLVTEKICECCINLMKNYIEYYSPKKFKTTNILESIR